MISTPFTRALALAAALVPASACHSGPPPKRGGLLVEEETSGCGGYFPQGGGCKWEGFDPELREPLPAPAQPGDERTPWLTLDVPGSDKIRWDGKELMVGPGRRTFIVDPGIHVLEAESPECRGLLRERLTVQEGERRRMALRRIVR